MKEFGSILIIGGIIAVLARVIFLLALRFSWPGHLPGDLHWSGKNGSFSFPLTTCILISIVLTLILNVVLRFFGK